MKKQLMKRAGVLPLVISLIISISGCGMLGGGAEQSIIETVDAFFDDVQSGRYAEEGFISDYAIDDPFSSIELDDERVQVLVEEGLSRVRYEIEEAQGSRSDGVGDCTVFVEVIDIAALFDDLSLDGYDEERIIEAMGERRVATTEIEVVFDLEYDSDDREWVIYDSSEFAEAFTLPYLSLVFPMSQTPEEAFEHFASAMKAGDIDTLANDYGFDWADGLDDEDEVLQEFIFAFLRNIEFYIDDVYVDDDFAEFYLTMVFPDPSIINQVFGETYLFEILMREIILSMYNEEDLSDDYVLQLYVDEIVDRLDSPQAPKIDVNDVYLSMYYSQGENAWLIDDFQDFSGRLETVFDMDLDFDFDDETLMHITVKVLSELFDEGLISEDFYNEAIEEYDIENIDSSDVTAQMLAEDINDFYWVDMDTEERVYAYDANATYMIEYVVAFNSYWDNIDIVVQWYYEDGDETELVYEFEHTLTSEYDEYSFWFGYSDYSYYLSAGTYYILMETLDGETILVDMVEVG